MQIMLQQRFSRKKTNPALQDVAAFFSINLPGKNCGSRGFLFVR